MSFQVCECTYLGFVQPSLLSSVKIAQEIRALISALWSVTALLESGSSSQLQQGAGRTVLSHRTQDRVVRMSNGNVTKQGWAWAFMS